MLIAPITVTTAVGASRSICHEILLIYEWTLWPQSKRRQRREQRQRSAPEAQNVLIIKIQNGSKRSGREGERESELQRTLNLVGSQLSLSHSAPLFALRSSVVPLFSGAYV